MELYENKDMKTFIRLKYYRDGASVGNEIDEEQIPNLPVYLKAETRQAGATVRSKTTRKNRERLQKKTAVFHRASAANPVHGHCT